MSAAPAYPEEFVLASLFAGPVQFASSTQFAPDEAA
jgi:hypothetical protein